MSDQDFTNTAPDVSGGSEEHPVAGGPDQGFEQAYINLAKDPTQDKQSLHYGTTSFKGSLEELFTKEPLTGVGAVEILYLEVNFCLKATTDYISGGIVMQYENTTKTSMIGLRHGNLSLGGNYNNIGRKQLHVLIDTKAGIFDGRCSTLVRPTSGMKPMMRLQVRANVPVAIFVKFRPIGVRTWIIQK